MWCFSAGHSVLCKMTGCSFRLFKFYICLKFFFIYFPLNPQSAMKIHAWWMDVWCWTPCGRLLLCCFLSYSQRLPRRTWPTLSWSWSSPTRQPRASPPAQSMRRSSSRRTSCNPASYLISATPVIYEILDTKSLFLYFHSCLLCGGSPFLTAFQVPSERYDAPFCKEQGPQPFG